MSIQPRLAFLFTALGCAALIGYAYYLQLHDHLEPCPMCIFQRLAYVAVGVVALLGFLHGPRAAGVYVYGVSIAIAAAIGGGIAGRQVWLQHLPEDQVPACGPGLDYMLEAFPLAEVIKTALQGSGECAIVDWTLLGRSMAEWSLLCFVVIVLAWCGYLVKFARRPREWA